MLGNQNPYKSSKTSTKDFLFITTSTFPHLPGKGDLLQHAISSHAAKARIPRLRTSNVDEKEDSNEPEKWKDSRRTRDRYTSKIKLQSWKRKSGRRRTVSQTDNQKLRPKPTWLQVRTGDLLIHELSPPNPLPITFFPNTGTLLNFYHCLNTNSFALNPDGDWFDLIRGDAAALHALISVAGRIRALQLRKEEEIDVRKHESEALKLINERLSASGEQVSDTLIAAVAVLVNQEAMSSSFETATIHIQGLAQMVKIRGGIENVNSRLVLQRVVAWGDFSYSTTWCRPLVFPRLASLNARLLPCPAATSSKTLRDANLLQSNAMPSAIFDAFDLLEAITYAIDNFETGNFGRIEISDSIYHAEYMLSEINAHTVPRVSEGAAAITAAALIFLHICLRSLPENAPRHRSLYGFVHGILQSPFPAALSRDHEAQNCVLLWLNCIGAADESNSILRGLHLSIMENCCLLLGVRTFEQFESSLKRVLWSKDYAYTRKTWEDVALGLDISQV